MCRSSIAGVVLCAAMLVARDGATQGYQQTTTAPRVPVARAAWQVFREPIVYAGGFYEPVATTVLFDGNLMEQTGIYRSVPVYQDVTIAPNAVLYLPVGLNLVRPYERRRAGDLAGTAAAATPSYPFPGESQAFPRSSQARGDRALSPRRPSFPDGGVDRCRTPAECTPATDGYPSAAGLSVSDFEPTTVQSIPGPQPSADDGVWIEFEGARWYLDGRSVSFDPARFTPSGNYRGFPVYRDNTGGDRLFVTVVADGPLAPFSRR